MVYTSGPLAIIPTLPLLRCGSMSNDGGVLNSGATASTIVHPPQSLIRSIYLVLGIVLLCTCTYEVPKVLSVSYNYYNFYYYYYYIIILLYNYSPGSNRLLAWQCIHDGLEIVSFFPTLNATFIFQLFLQIGNALLQISVFFQ